MSTGSDTTVVLLTVFGRYHYARCRRAWRFS